MSLNPNGATSYNWNYSKPDRDGFSLELIGTVVSVQEVQARHYNPGSNQPGAPRFWPDGNPVFNMRVGFAVPDGSLKTITFMRGGSKRKSGLHWQLYELVGNMDNLIGKTIHIWTWPNNPETGQPWGQGNPRLFGCELADGHFELASPLPDEYKVERLLCNDAVHGGQPTPPAPQQMQTPQAPPMYGQFYAPPTAQQFQQPMQYQQSMQYQQPMMQQQPMVQQPVMQQPQPAIQAMPPQTAPMPQGMDPAVAAAMQSVGAVNVQPAGDPYSIYDDDIPFA